MKRTVLLLLVLCLLLTGCGVKGGAPTSAEPDTATEETSAPTTAPAAEQSLLDVREAFDDSGVLWYIPNEQIEAQEYPTLHAFAEGLLMASNSYIDDGNNELTLTLLSMATGEALNACTLHTNGYTEPQVLGEYLAVCDSAVGEVVILDAQLREVARHTIAADWGQWIVSPDLDTLYKCSYLDGIRAVSLSTGAPLFDVAIADLSVCGVSEEGICFTGVDRETQKYGAFCLEFSDSTPTAPPFSGDFFRINRSGAMWLGGFCGAEDTFAFGSGADARFTTVREGTLSLLDPLGQIVFTDFNGDMSLYDSDGAFLSSCKLIGRYAQSFIWCEALGGYLLLANDGESDCRLLFWDIGAKTDGEALQTRPLADRNAVPDGTSADASLYERAQSLSDRFGVEILIADRCETEFAYFSCYQVSDDWPVSTGLDILETALSALPEDFLGQLLYGHIDRIQFQLVGGLTATNGFGGDGSYAAFTDANSSVCLIVLDVYSIAANSVWHELSHAIDRRLAWDAMYREDALFSEDGWSAHNPADFAYSEEYGAARYDISSEWYGYFVDDYAMINATEDRARIFENAMDNGGTLFQNAGLREKLQYYSDCIRDCFDTALWQETAAWEEPLR